MDFLLQAGDVQQLVVCGGLFGSETKAALAEINQELPRLLQRMAVQVMPGQGEPSNTSLPQLQRLGDELKGAFGSKKLPWKWPSTNWVE